MDDGRAPSDFEQDLVDALDQVEYGIVLLDAHMGASFINAAYYKMWGLPPAPPGRRYMLVDLMAHAARTRAYQVPSEQLEAFLRDRVAGVIAGNLPPTQLRLRDGRALKSECIALKRGGRMLTYADVSDLVQTAEKFEVLATTDALTGLHNRRHFDSAGAAEISRSRRYNRALSVMMIDADHFKQVNDTHGHDVGDEVLRALAEAARTSVRKTDVVGRLGGEEFAIALPETNDAIASQIAEKIRKRVGDAPIVTKAGPLRVTVSVGVASLDPAMTTFGELLKAADVALYIAKQNGRNRVVRAGAAAIAEAIAKR
ncbi:MAG TPA: diguanylate cyclase [Candidatus Sulfotelmatobacter sp.]|nr:diguanylate cyclase [Candidatus Sulfotelmatobacter sp.]